MFDDQELSRLVYRCAQIVLVVFVASAVGLLALKAFRPTPAQGKEFARPMPTAPAANEKGPASH